jgi:hypothetical protein
MDFIYLPVSLGEAIDKLTILDIKINNIIDNRKDDVQKEYDILYDKLKHFILEYNDLYKTMKKVNQLIWNMMNILRDENIDENKYLKICKECIEYNDIRFRVKNKINYLCNSSLKEQKSYKINRLIIDISDKITEINDFIKPIKYYSFFYDEIIIIHKQDSKLKNEFNYDPTIIFTETTYEKEYKQKISFNNISNNYNKESIYNIFSLNDNIINIFH